MYTKSAVFPHPAHPPNNRSSRNDSNFDGLYNFGRNRRIYLSLLYIAALRGMQLFSSTNFVADLDAAGDLLGNDRYYKLKMPITQ